MKALPTDHGALRARIFGALCDDISDIGAGRTKSFDRTDALRRVVKLNPEIWGEEIET